MIGSQLTALGYALLGFPVVLAAVAATRSLAGYRVGPTTAVTTLYGCVLVAVAFLPLPGWGAPRLEQTVQAVPFQWVADIGTELHRHDLPGTAIPLTSAFLQVAMNVALFVPLGALLRHRFRVGFTGAAASGFAVSALIELAQLTANLGTAPFPYRVCDVDDLVANTTGGVLGVVLMTVVTAKTVSRAARYTPDSADARVARVG